MSEGSLGESGKLDVKLVRADGKIIEHHSLAQVFQALELGAENAFQAARDYFQTNLVAHHRDANGNIVDHSDTHIVLPDGGIHLGSGLVTNVGVNLMAWNDVNNGIGPTLNNIKYHAIGTGATAAAATDYFLQTAQGATNLTGTTNGYMTGTQVVVAPNQYQTVATFTASGAISVTEWALAMNNAANVARTSAGAAPTGTTFTDTGATYATAGNGLKGFSIEISATAVNTPTTTVQGLVTSNTATVLTLAEGWWTLANASGSTPGATIAYIIVPTAFDHKQFSVVTLASGDTLQFTYTLTINSGG